QICCATWGLFTHNSMPVAACDNRTLFANTTCFPWLETGVGSGFGIRGTGAGRHVRNFSQTAARTSKPPYACKSVQVCAAVCKRGQARPGFVQYKTRVPMTAKRPLTRTYSIKTITELLDRSRRWVYY